MYHQAFYNYTTNHSFNEISEKIINKDFPHINLLDVDIDYINNEAEKLNEFDDIVIIGMGGSLTNPESFVRITNFSKIHFVKTTDPHQLEHLISNLDLKKTVFLAISKSGNTLEVLSGVLLVSTYYKKHNLDFSKNFVFINDNSNNPLRQFATEYNIKCHEHPNIGGRYSSLTIVGLLPAAIAGLKIDKILKGAEVIRDDFKNNLSDSIAAKSAIFSYEQIINGKSLSVFMPYARQLKAFSTWYAQIWAESLGKNNKGSTPIIAMGPLDQHSQLQLYLDGPNDKFFNLINLKNYNQEIKINPSIVPKSLQYLANKGLGNITTAEHQSTKETLINAKKPLRNITVERVDEEVIGGLFLHFTIETIFTAFLLNVNPFDQPAVEEGKILARKILENDN